MKRKLWWLFYTILVVVAAWYVALRISRLLMPSSLALFLYPLQTQRLSLH